MLTAPSALCYFLIFVFIKSTSAFYRMNGKIPNKSCLTQSFGDAPVIPPDRDIPYNCYILVKMPYTLYHKLTGSQSFFGVFWNNSVFFIINRVFPVFIWIIFQNPLFFSAFLLRHHAFFAAFLLGNLRPFPAYIAFPVAIVAWDFPVFPMQHCSRINLFHKIEISLLILSIHCAILPSSSKYSKFADGNQ